MVRVEVQDIAVQNTGLAVVLAGGRRVEIGLHFEQAALVRLFERSKSHGRAGARSGNEDLSRCGAGRYAQGIEGLFGLVRDVHGHDPLSGHLYLWLATADGPSIRMRSEELPMLLSGLDVAQARSRRGW